MYQGQQLCQNVPNIIISQHALLDLRYNICTKFHSNPCKDEGGVEKTNFMERKDGMTEGRNDRQSKH